MGFVSIWTRLLLSSSSLAYGERRANRGFVTVWLLKRRSEIRDAEEPRTSETEVLATRSLDRPGKGGRGCFLAQSIGNISTERQRRRIRRSEGHAGGESSDAATIWKHGAADRRAAIADGIGAAPRKQTGRTKERDGEVYKKSFEMSNFRTRGGRTGPFPGLPKSLGMERIRNGSNGGPLMFNR